MLLKTMGSKTTAPPGLQIYLQPGVTSTVDFSTPKLIVSCLAKWSICANLHFQNIVFTCLFGNRWMTERTGWKH